MKKLVSVILSLILITSWSLTMLPVCAADGWTAISSAQDLANINNNLSGNYFLTQNIDMTGFAWDSIGTEAFRGVLDGNGYIITNLSCESYMNRVGGLIMDNQGTVKNLCIYNFSITAKDVQYDNVGVICGLNNGTIENCHVYGTLNNPAAQYVGMLCGSNYGTIINCSAAGSVYAAYHVGGIAGQNKNMGTIMNCVNYASVTTVHNRAGGIVGTMQTNTGAEYCILNCINYGNVTSEPCTDSDSHGSVGGLVGHYQKDACPVSNSITFGQLTGRNCISATVGNASATAVASVDNCYYLSGCQTNTAVINSALEKGTEFTMSNVGALISKLGSAFTANNGSDAAVYPILLSTFWQNGFSSYNYYDAHDLADATDIKKPAAISTVVYKAAETTQPDVTTTASSTEAVTAADTTAAITTKAVTESVTTTAVDTTAPSTSTSKGCGSILYYNIALIPIILTIALILLKKEKSAI